MDQEKHLFTSALPDMDTKDSKLASADAPSSTSNSERDVDPETTELDLNKVQKKVDRKLFMWYCFVYLIMRQVESYYYQLRLQQLIVYGIAGSM